ncbi:MAG: ABC transporter ATP-binding protein [Acidobacteriia bacterium]|nr:ABC transporter ATP-binding protein [Terriglobia bacterium]
MKVVYDNVVKKYGHVLGVDQLQLQIQAGEFIVLLGPSGCGKTTTLRMLAGLESVTSGGIYIGDDRVNEMPPRDRDVAMVFQSYALYPHMTVAENIAYPLRVRRVPQSEIPDRVQKVAELLGIRELLLRKPKELSGGQRQRVALARAIVRQPRVFLMDEPLSNLDAKLRLYTRGELKRLQYELGTTTLYVTHDQAEAMTLAHRVAVMDGGRLQQFDTPLATYQRPANKFVAGFMGSPSMNFLEGKLDHAERRFAGPDVTLRLADQVLSPLHAFEKVTLGVRPEDVALSTKAFEGGLPATVYVTEALGNETYVFLSLGQGRIVARAEPSMRFEIESRVWLSFDETKLHFFDCASGNRLP